MRLAHSSPDGIRAPDPYGRHVGTVMRRAEANAEQMLRFATHPPSGLCDSIRLAAAYHDLGKLDPDNQAALASGRRARLPWDHIDVGVAHARAVQDMMAAWMIRAHHAPGLPSQAEQFEPGCGLRLRGRRGDRSPTEQRQQIARTDTVLRECLATHHAEVGETESRPRRAVHGLTMRLALSCLVDADHSDTAAFDHGPVNLAAAAPRWGERIEALKRYVAALPAGSTAAEADRNAFRTAFFEASLWSSVRERLASCDALVGSGKTTSVLAYLLRCAQEEGLRRIIIVAPFTNILTQTAERLRAALVLPGEDPDTVVVEHHHRADFDSREARELAVTWSAPIVLTTAVSFFESLAGCSSATLRKLHAVPGSGIVLDEAHAALPTKLWNQNWRWLRELAEKWGCRVVLASGSLTRFWEDKTIVGDAHTVVPDLLPRDLAERGRDAERRRVAYARLADRVVPVDELVDRVVAAPGPRLVILNTVQSAAVIAIAMKETGLTVVHLSTALAPEDRALVVARIDLLLKARATEWVLVATSCVEAGVDFSFRTAFRQSFSTASTIQVGGRVNRHGEWNEAGGGVVYDFDVEGARITLHPGCAASARVLHDLMRRDALNTTDPAALVTQAMKEELRLLGPSERNLLQLAETHQDYPGVSKHGRVIDTDTRLVVVQKDLKALLRRGAAVPFRALLAGSVQLWSTKVSKLALEPIVGYGDLFYWPMKYDPVFLGIMAGVLDQATHEIPSGLLV